MKILNEKLPENKALNEPKKSSKAPHKRALQAKVNFCVRF